MIKHTELSAHYQVIIIIIDIAHLILIHWIISFLLYCMCQLHACFVEHTPDIIPTCWWWNARWMLYHPPLTMWYLCIMHKCCNVHNDCSTNYPLMSWGRCTMAYPTPNPTTQSPLKPKFDKPSYVHIYLSIASSFCRFCTECSSDAAVS